MLYTHLILFSIFFLTQSAILRPKRIVNQMYKSNHITMLHSCIVKIHGRGCVGTFLDSRTLLTTANCLKLKQDNTTDAYPYSKIQTVFEDKNSGSRSIYVVMDRLTESSIYLTYILPKVLDHTR